jgi:hypothetical protein
MSVLRYATAALCTAAAVACTLEPNPNKLAPSATTRDLTSSSSQGSASSSQGSALSTQESAGPSASGHGNFTQAPGVLRTFSFEGRVMPDGSVEGNFNNHNRLGGIVNHGDIDCLRLIGTNGAVLSGPIRKHTDPAFEGWTAGFRVEDNGEGSNESPDRVSVIFVVPPGRDNCQAFTPGEPSMRVLEGGNVQVRP